MPKKAERSIPDGEWGSQVSKYPADSSLVGLNDITADSKNYDTHAKGVLTKRKGSIPYNTLSNPAQDQYEAIFSNGVRHLITVQDGDVEYSSGDQSINAVVNGTGFTASGNFEFATISDRIYMGNGVNVGQVYDKTAVYGGAAPASVPRLKVMGCQVPGTAPTATMVVGAGVPVGAHTYKVTFEYYDFEESNGSPASNLVTVVGGANQQVDLTAVPIGGYGVTARKIYRDNNDGNWHLVGTIENNTDTTFSDNASIGTALIPEINDVPPIFGQIINFLDRAWISDIVGEPHTVRHSEAGQPNIFRSDNYVVCNERDPITTKIAFLDRIIVLNRNSMGQILGKSADTFRYSEIQSSVGCVDSRSVQVRIIRGVPKLIWLSDKGIYTYNGNSTEYISENIEDLVNLNIQQGVQTRGQNSQTSKADFQAGTPSNGIDLDTIEGSIITKPVTRLWDDQADWEGGSVETNVSTKDLANTLQMPKTFSPGLDDGAFDGLETFAGDTIRILPSTDFTGDSKTGTYNPGRLNIPASVDGIDDLSIPIRATRSGNITNIQITLKMIGSSYQPTQPVYVELWDDIGGIPGSVQSSSVQNLTWPVPAPSIEFNLNTGGISFPVVGNTTYWIVIRLAPGIVAGAGVLKIDNAKIVNSEYEGAGAYAYGRHDNGGWARIEHNQTNSTIGNVALAYTFSATPVGASGQWLSPIYDTHSDRVSATLKLHTAGYTYTTGKTSTTTLEGSDDPNFIGGIEASGSLVDLTDVATDVTGVFGKRYWRIRVQMTTDDTRTSGTIGIGPFMKAMTLYFNPAATWESEVIDCSSDVTSYSVLNIIKTEPSGTSVTS